MLLQKKDVYFYRGFKNKTQAIQEVGKLMVNKGLVSPQYIKSMVKRDKKTSVAIGNHLAIPHGEYEAAKYVKKSGMVFLKLDQPLQWDDDQIWFVVGLALTNDQQLEVLQSLALHFTNLDEVQKMYYEFDNPEQIINFLEKEVD